MDFLITNQIGMLESKRNYYFNKLGSNSVNYIQLIIILTVLDRIFSWWQNDCKLPFDEKLESHFTHLKDLSLPCKVICLMMEPFVIKMFSQMLYLFVCFLFLCCWHVIRKAIWRNLEVRNLEILHNILFWFFFKVENWDSQEGRDSCLKINKYYIIFRDF